MQHSKRGYALLPLMLLLALLFGFGASKLSKPTPGGQQVTQDGGGDPDRPPDPPYTGP